MLKLTSHIIGLEQELLSGVGAKEQNIYNFICALYIIILLLASVAGAYLFYMIDDHFFSIIFGGFVFVFLFSAIFRVLLITNRASILDVQTTTSKFRKLLPTMSGFLRFVIGGIFSIVLAFPLASAKNHKMVLRISAERTAEIKYAMKGEGRRLLVVSLNEDLKHTHFPLSVFEELIATKKVVPFIVVIFGLVLAQQFMLNWARRGKTFLYQSLAREKYIELVSKDYEETITNGFKVAEQRFNADLSKEKSELAGFDKFLPVNNTSNSLKQNYAAYDKQEDLVKKRLGL